MNSQDPQEPSDPAPAKAADAAIEQDTQPHSEFAPTLTGAPDSVSPDWWPESSDGHCSERAALFAASQPAPLNVV
ncbi:MAG: hypothetical protein LH632_14180 [Rhodoferax sp.]|nr:hypothetical protein [Rhodoferax sp.]